MVEALEVGAKPPRRVDQEEGAAGERGEAAAVGGMRKGDAES